MREQLQHKAIQLQLANEGAERREQNLRVRVQELERELAAMQRERDDIEQESHLVARDAHKAQQEVVRLKAYTLELEGDVSAANRQAAATEMVLHGAESFQRTARGWYFGAISSLSKGTQATCRGDSRDPRAFPPKARGSRRSKAVRSSLLDGDCSDVHHAVAISTVRGDKGQRMVDISDQSTQEKTVHIDDFSDSDSELLEFGVDYQKLDPMESTSLA